MRILPARTKEADKRLSAWFWRTAYSGYFSGARDRDVAQALKVIRHLASGVGEGNARQDIGKASSEVSPLPARYDFRISRCKLFVLRLLERQPQASSGEQLDTSQVVFTYGTRVVMQLFVGKEVDRKWRSSPANRFIVRPTDHKLFREQLLSPSQATTLAPEFLRSHAISELAIEALMVGNPVGFLVERRRILIEQESEFVEQLGLKYREDE